MFLVQKSYIPIYKGGIKAHLKDKIISFIGTTLLVTDLPSQQVDQKEFKNEISYIAYHDECVQIGFIDGSFHDKQMHKLHKSSISFIFNYGNILLTGSSDKTAKISVDGQTLATIYCKNVVTCGLIHNDVIFVGDSEGSIYKRDGINGHTVRFRGVPMKTYKMFYEQNKLYCFGNEKVVIYFTKTGNITDVLLDEKKLERKIGNVFYEEFDIQNEDVVFVQNQLYFVADNRIMVYNMEMKFQEEHLISLDDKNKCSLLFKSIDFTDQFIVTTTEDEIIFLNEEYIVESTIIGNNDEITDMVFFNDKLFICTNSGRLRYAKTLNRDGLFCCKAFLLEAHSQAIMNVSILGNRLVTCSRDCSVIVWDLIEGNKEQLEYSEPGVYNNKITLKTHLESVNSCDISKEIIVTASSDKTLQIFTNTPKPKHIFTKVIHEKEINVVQINEERRIIATASHDKTVKIFSFHGEELQTLSLHRRGVWTLDLGKDIIVTGSSDETIRIWSLNDYECIRILEGHNSSVIKVKLYDNDKKLLSSDNSGILRLWDVKRGKMLSVLDFHKEKIWSIIFSTLIYTASTDGIIKAIKDETERTTEIENEKKRLTKQITFDIGKCKREHDYFNALKLAYNLDDIKEIFNLIEKCIHSQTDLNAMFLIFESDKIKLIKIVMRYLKIFKHIEIIGPLVREMLKRKYFNSQNNEELVNTMKKIYRNADELSIGLGSLELLFRDIIIERFK